MTIELFTRPRGSAAKRLTKLQAELEQRNLRERELHETYRQLQAEHEALSERLAECDDDLPLDGSPPPAGTEAHKLLAARGAVEAKLADRRLWEKRASKAQLRVQEAEGAIARHVTEHLG